MSTRKFHNFLRSTTFLLVFFPFDGVFKIQNLNFLNSDVVFVDKMISNEKLSTKKFYNFSRSTKFILIVLSFVHFT
jgi:hypothetical protein